MRKFVFLILLISIFIVSFLLFLPKDKERVLIPVAFDSPLPSPVPEFKVAKAIFVGDIMLSRQVARQIEKHNDFAFPFLKIKDFLNSADFVFGNLEGPVSDLGQNQGSVYSFRHNPQVLPGLRSANFKVLSLANNHIWDWGKAALLQSMDLLSSHGIVHVGAGKDFNDANEIKILESSGIKFGFFAATNLYPESLQATISTPGISSSDLKFLVEKVKAAKTESLADFYIVSLHWGNEYEKEPQSWQIDAAHSLVEAGADLIVGHHPHVAQTQEQFPLPETGEGSGKWIFYSLGNFVFDQGFSKETMTGLAALVEFKIGESKEIKPKLFQININESFQPELGPELSLISLP